LAILTAALAMLAVGLVAFKFWPRTGTLTVTVAGPNRAPVDAIEIRVDDRTVCRQSPCSVAKVAVGAHTVDVTAPGYVKSATRAAEIEIDKTALLDFSLTLATTGLRVGALGPNLRLFVDGKDRGPLPASVDDVGAGSHSIRIEGNEHYRPFEQQLTLGPGEIKTLEPKLRVAKGLARLEPGENLKGARVWLVCGSGPKVALALPTVKEVAAEQGCRVEASKGGFENARLDLSFDDGSAEKSFTIDLARTAVPPPTPPVAARASRATARSATLAAAARPAVAKPAPPPPQAKPAVAAGPQGAININSMPVSSVTVDGAPAGQTPARVSVPAGNHTVVFAHPQKGRKSLTVKVRAGATTSAVVRFD
jgi:serine/threonine-protein kinase